MLKLTKPTDWSSTVPEASLMAETVFERVGKTEQEIHTLKHRVGDLERLPDRVTATERSVQDLTANMIHVQERQQELRDDMRNGFDAVHGKFDDVSEKIDSGFKELRAAVAVGKGEKSGFSRALQVVTWMIGIITAAAGLLMWSGEIGQAKTNKAVCQDETYSTSSGRGTCSDHGGVKYWIPD